MMSVGQNIYRSGLSSSGFTGKQADTVVAGIQFAFKIGSCFAILGLIFSLFIRRAILPNDR